MLPKPTIVRKSATLELPFKELAPAEQQQAPAPETADNTADSIEVEEPVQEEPVQEEPVQEEPEAEPQSVAEQQPEAEQQPAAKELPATAPEPLEDSSQPATDRQPAIAATETQPSPQPETEQPAAVKPTPGASATTMPRTAAGDIHRENWLLAQDASTYTIQIIGVSTEKTLLSFIERNQLLQQNDLAYYESVLNGKPWFQALYGIYPTKEEAREAIKMLPENIRLGGPWIRSMAAVQNTISK